MAEEAPSSNGVHSDVPDGDGSRDTANGTGVTLKFEGAPKRKRPLDLTSERYEGGSQLSLSRMASKVICRQHETSHHSVATGTA